MNQQGSICETRKGLNRPPIRRGIECIAYAHVSKKRSTFEYFGNRCGRKCIKGTSTRQDLSFAPTPTSIRTSITQKQPGKAHVSKNRCFRKLRPASASFGQFPVTKSGHNCQKTHLHTKTFHLSLFPGSMTISYKDKAWKRIQDGRTPKIYRPPTFGVGA